MADVVELKPLEEGIEKTSVIQRLRKEIEDLKRERVEEEFKKNVIKISENVEKLINLNINFHAKIAELLIKLSNLSEEVSTMIDLLQKASEEEGVDYSEEMSKILKQIRDQNDEMLRILKNIEEYTYKEYKKRLIRKVFEKTGEKK